MPDRQTNHNRQDSSSSGAGATFGDSSGSGLFKLCQKSHPMSRPHGSQNLFDLYGLNDVAKAMARTDPVTGEKINKLRKSYEGQIKSLQIAGKPKAVKMDGVFTNLLDMPDDFYHAQHEQGKGFDTALSDVDSKTVTPNFDALLDAAFAGIGPGSFSTTDSNRFRAYLGTDDTARPKPQMDGPSARHIPSSSAPTPAASGMASRPSRPERAGAKRNYTDLSFAGYGEGFTDDGYSEAGEGDSQGLSKKRRLGFERTSHPVEVGGARGR
ncbi:Rox3-domain-containing protein [Sporormia fimetaria CBS 119925]|uniref:Mediator of RNA polymerase II transcription subunit 19 n=1 Tax=Sporormia fimetaria CBS 119925 TaxID=1340428 RepID=A0A6A6VDL7_9PLEO|nr:Rox3-domain-containing protein [Sporormia fimetaria CBS 119925]